MDEHNLIFLSYTKADKDRVIDFYSFLDSSGFNVWMDKDLKGGQEWDFYLKRELHKATIVIMFISHNSVDHRGYVQRELRLALDRQQEKLIDDIYIIPVLLDEDAKIPYQISNIQYISERNGDIKLQLIDSINFQLERLGLKFNRVQEKANFSWFSTKYNDNWDGLPGYDNSFQLFKFSSKEYKHIFEISDVIRGWLTEEIMNCREVKYQQDCEFYNFGQDRFLRQNIWEAICDEPVVKGRVISITYNILYYNAGAAHSNQYFKTFSFVLEPLTQIKDLASIFTNQAEAFSVIQNEVRVCLLNFKLSETDIEPESDSEWVNEGTKEWDSYSNFRFADKGIEILFPPYQVAAYAYGPQFVTIEYNKIFMFMHKHYAYMLGLSTEIVT